MINSLINSEELIQTKPSSLLNYLIIDIGYNVLTVEEILYQVGSDVTHEEILIKIISFCKMEHQSTSKIRLLVKYYFEKLSEDNCFSSFEREYEELYKIFTTFVIGLLLIKAQLSDCSLNRFTVLKDPTLDSLLFIENSKNARSLYTPLGNARY